MKRYTGLVILVITLVAIFTAAYMFYGKYGGQMILQVPLPGAQTPGQAGNGTGNGGGAGDDEQDLRDAASDDQQQGIPDDGQEQQHTGTGGQNRPDTADDVKIMAPDFTLKDMDGNDVSLSDYRGKIVILNFWAVWCRYCIEEMPDFNELDRELEKAGDAVILAVNVQEPYDTVEDYLSENDIDLKVLLDEDGYVAAGIYGVNGFPTTFIINSDGSLYTYIPGKTDIETMRTVIDMARNNEPLR